VKPAASSVTKTTGGTGKPKTKESTTAAVKVPKTKVEGGTTSGSRRRM
jgi:hypothetical protein